MECEDDGEETIDDLLKDLRENSNQNKLMKNQRLYKKKCVKSNENLTNNANNLSEIASQPQFPIIFTNDPSIQFSQNIKTKPKGAFKKFIGKSESNKFNDILFNEYAMILIPDKNELTEIRIKIITQQILKRKGNYFGFSDFRMDLQNFLKENLNRIKIVISSKTNLYETCERFFCRSQCDLRNCEFPILDFEWLTECFRCNEIVDPNIYSSFFIFKKFFKKF